MSPSNVTIAISLMSICSCSSGQWGLRYRGYGDTANPGVRSRTPGLWRAALLLDVRVVPALTGAGDRTSGALRGPHLRKALGDGLLPALETLWVHVGLVGAIEATRHRAEQICHVLPP